MAGATKLLLEQFSNFPSDLTWPRIQEAIRTDDLLLIDIDAELAQSASYCYKMISGSWRRNNKHAFSSHKNQTLIDPYEGLLRRLKESVLNGPETLDARIRSAAGARDEIPGAIGNFVNKVARRDYRWDLD